MDIELKRYRAGRKEDVAEQKALNLLVSQQAEAAGAVSEISCIYYEDGEIKTKAIDPADFYADEVEE